MSYEEEQNAALNKVTIELLESLESGQTIELTEDFEIYHYDDEEHVVVIDKENDEEIFCVQWSVEENEICYTPL
jgi:hypothetical protein